MSDPTPLPPEIEAALDEYASALHHDQYALMGPTKRHAARATVTAAITRALHDATTEIERLRCIVTGYVPTDLRARYEASAREAAKFATPTEDRR